MKIRIIRSQKILTDADLAQAIGMSTKALISFYKRNSGAFAPGAVFNLTRQEREDLVQNYCFTHAERLRYAKRLPYIFTKPAVIQIICMRAKSAPAKALREKFFNHPQISAFDIEELK